MATNQNHEGSRNSEASMVIARTAEGYEVSSEDLTKFAAKRNLSKDEAVKAIALLSYGVFCVHLDEY